MSPTGFLKQKPYHCLPIRQSEYPDPAVHAKSCMCCLPVSSFPWWLRLLFHGAGNNWLFPLLHPTDRHRYYGGR
eukprot:12903038-Prorocentrum_lima.AAC.1